MNRHPGSIVPDTGTPAKHFLSFEAGRSDFQPQTTTTLFARLAVFAIKTVQAVRGVAALTVSV